MLSSRDENVSILLAIFFTCYSCFDQKTKTYEVPFFKPLSLPDCIAGEGSSL